MTRGNNKNIVFKEDGDYRYYLKLMQKYKSELPFDLFHYCLMPSHVHMLVHIIDADEFSLFMKKINLAYFYHFKQVYGWVGHFWQDRFKSQPVGKDSYFIQCGKYIELNPVRKGLVGSPEDYKYSSFRHYGEGMVNGLVTNDIFYKELGSGGQKRQQEYQKMMVDEIVAENYSEQVWGSKDQRYNERNKRHQYFLRHNKIT